MLNSNMAKYYLFLLGIIFQITSYTCEKKVGMGKMVQKVENVSEHVFKEYAIATDSPICSKIGSDILGKNGTAVDATIAAIFCLGVIHPHSSGIGGGGFILLHDAEKSEQKFFDFRETAASCANPNMAHLNHTLVSMGPLSIAVPGELKGLYEIWKRYSNYKWKDLILPTINILKNGIEVDYSLYFAIEKFSSIICNEKTMKNIFCPNGNILEKGQKYYNPELLTTLNELMRHGIDIFYKNMSEGMAKEIQNSGGCITSKDISEYEIKETNPIILNFETIKLILSPLPTSGPILGFILNTFKGFNFKPEDVQNKPVIVYHCLIEVLKFAYSFRTKLSDPYFNKDSEKLALKLLNPEFADSVRKRIFINQTNPPSYYGLEHDDELKTGTTHLVVTDKYGNMVSCMSTVNGYFGAKMRSEKYGIIYNNEMDDFSFPKLVNDYSLPPNHRNFPAPGKRPMSSSVPTIIVDNHNHPLFAAGGSGGTIITSAVAQVIINHVIFGMSLKDAIDTPRLHTQLSPDTVYFETRFNNHTFNELKKLGHKIEVSDIQHAVVQALAKIPENHEWLYHSFKKESIHSHLTKIFAESDFRKGGLPSGY